MLQASFFAKALFSFFKKRKIKKEKIFEYKNITTRYYEVGKKGPNMLIIPGFGQSLNSWAEIGKILSNKFHVVIIELPNRGKKQGFTEHWDEKDFSNYILGFIKIRIKGKLILCGHSLGGKVCAIVTTTIPNNISFLILYAVGGVKTTLPFSSKIIKVLKNTFFGKQSNIDFTQVFSKVSVPTFLLYGQRDLIAPVEMGKRISELIPNSKLEIVPSGTHLMHEELSELFIHMIYDSLS